MTAMKMISEDDGNEDKTYQHNAASGAPSASLGIIGSKHRAKHHQASSM